MIFVHGLKHKSQRSNQALQDKLSSTEDENKPEASLRTNLKNLQMSYKQGFLISGPKTTDPAN